MPDKEKDESVEMTEDQLGELIGNTVDEKMAEVNSNIKSLMDHMQDLRKEQPSILGEPNTQEQEEVPDHVKRWAEKLKGDPTQLPEDEFSFIRFMNAQRTGEWKGAEIEHQAWRKTQEKALAWASGSSGGYWVGAEFLPQKFIDMLYAQMVCKKAGCQTWRATGAPVNVPTKTAGTTAYWVGQNATLTASDTTPGQLQFTPKWCVGRSQLSDFLVQSSAGLAEQIAREDIATQIGIESDKQMLIGAGTSNKPTGIAVFTAPAGRNTVAIGTNGGAITLAHCHSMLYECEVDNVRFVKPAWFMHPRTWNVIRQLQTVNYSAQTVGGDYYFRPDVSQLEKRSILGFPVYTTTSLPINLTKGTGTALAYVILADANDIVLCEWGAIELKATDVGGNAWTQNAIEIKGTYTHDVGVRHGPAVCVISDTTS